MKETLLLPTPVPPRSSWTSRLLIIRAVSLAAIFAIVHLYAKQQLPFRLHLGFNAGSSADLCPQTASVRPKANSRIYTQVAATIGTEGYRRRAVDWLSGAVREPTESYDSMGAIGEDVRWETFRPLHDYLLRAFPLTHTLLNLTKVNTYGLVYHWQGSEMGSKPLLLTAHQDVVPVDPKTVDQWIHPPYSGHFDGTYIWGRGSVDDKSGLISILSTVETLLEIGFIPTRSIVVAFGFDEEASGVYGAANISKYLMETYGENEFAMLVDEGGGLTEMYGAIIASPAVGEKGYLDVQVKVNTPGGHSSIPPAHTGIGVLSNLLVAMENDPIVPSLSRNQIVYGMLKCIAQAPLVPKDLREDIIKSPTCDAALKRVEKATSPLLRPLFGTTQAIDLINGGVKANALPEEATAVVNHRISDDSSVDVVKGHITKVLIPVASKFNLSVHSFGDDLSEEKPTHGSLTLSDAWGTALAPAPISPSGPDALPFALLSASIKATIEDANVTDKQVIVAPGIMTGNTDTRYYWKLTRHIFRYSHHGLPGDMYPGGGVHTVNEAISIDSIIRQIRFFTLIILNSDENSLE